MDTQRCLRRSRSRVGDSPWICRQRTLTSPAFVDVNPVSTIWCFVLRESKKIVRVCNWRILDKRHTLLASYDLKNKWFALQWSISRLTILECILSHLIVCQMEGEETPLCTFRHPLDWRIDRHIRTCTACSSRIQVYITVVCDIAPKRWMSFSPPTYPYPLSLRFRNLNRHDSFHCDTQRLYSLHVLRWLSPLVSLCWNAFLFWVHRELILKGFLSWSKSTCK